MWLILYDRGIMNFSRILVFLKNFRNVTYKVIWANSWRLEWRTYNDGYLNDGSPRLLLYPQSQIQLQHRHRSASNKIKRENFLGNRWRHVRLKICIISSMCETGQTFCRCIHNYVLLINRCINDYFILFLSVKFDSKAYIIKLFLFLSFIILHFITWKKKNFNSSILWKCDYFYLWKLSLT